MWTLPNARLKKKMYVQIFDADDSDDWSHSTTKKAAKKINIKIRVSKTTKKAVKMKVRVTTTTKKALSVTKTTKKAVQKKTTVSKLRQKACRR